jgi:Catalytic LigB subunit of aromatic ring-opening dioxygenase.
MGSSHGPMLSTPPEEWGQRVLADKKNKEHYYKSRTWTFDQLVEARKAENLGKQIELPVWRERHAACRKALGQLAAVFAEVKPDVAVIVGNDQKEIFRDAYTPAISVFYGKTIVNTMFSDERIAALPPGIAIAIPGHIPPGGATYPGAPELGQHIVKSLVADEFDVSTLTELPHDETPTRSASSIGRSCSTRRCRASPSSSTRSIRPISRACGAATGSASRW